MFLIMEPLSIIELVELEIDSLINNHGTYPDSIHIEKESLSDSKPGNLVWNIKVKMKVNNAIINIGVINIHKIPTTLSDNLSAKSVMIFQRSDIQLKHVNSVRILAMASIS